MSSNSNDKFYSGGFFYNPRTHKVLLHKRDSNTDNSPDQWAFFGGLSEQGENPLQTFIREIKEELCINIEASNVESLCDYFNSDFDTHRYVFFVKKDVDKSKMTLQEGADFDWISFDEVFKYDLTKRTNQDLKTFYKKHLT